MNRKQKKPNLISPIVVKLGGSLHDHVADIVPVLLASGRRLLIVPGGGVFADAVRKTGADDDSAHWMAVAAMDQYGWFISSQGIGTTSLLQVPDQPVIFLPYCMIKASDPLPHSWEVTSDSLAAWVAYTLELDLLLLKSVDGIFRGRKVVHTVKAPLKTDVVDPFFLPFVLEKKVPAAIINGSRPDRIAAFLRGEVVPGTMIGTTF